MHDDTQQASVWPRRSVLAAAAGAGVLGLTAQSAHATGVHEDSPSDPRLVGTWNLTVRFPSGLENPTLIAFSSVGSLVETNALTRSTGLGSWRKHREGFSYRFWEQLFDANDQLTNLVRVDHTVAIAREGTSYTGSGIGYVYDLDGALSSTVATELAAIRLG